MEKEIKECLLALSDVGGELIGIGEGLSGDTGFCLRDGDYLAAVGVFDLEADLMEAMSIVQLGLRITEELRRTLNGQD